MLAEHKSKKQKTTICPTDRPVDYQCMHPNTKYGVLAETIHQYHLRWGLLSTPRKLPKRHNDLVNTFILKCETDSIFAGTMATLSQSPLLELCLTEEEVDGEVAEEGDVMFRTIHDRIVLGNSFSEKESFLNSKFSMTVELLDGAYILRKMNQMIPCELFPSATDTKEKVLRRNDECLWLDKVWRHGHSVPTNGDPTSKQPCRRTVAVLDNFPAAIPNPLCCEEVGKFVARMPVYTCREMPITKWMSRPATNGELAIVLHIWRCVWPLLRKPSRQFPPNAWQIIVYQRLLHRKMGPHRDNFSRNSLKDISEGKCAFKKPKKWSGVENSQMDGSCVIIYSFGNSPMRMVFMTLGPDGDAFQEKKKYEVSPTFSFQFCEGYICILDCIDDMLMYHSLDFVGVKTEGTPGTMVRAAMVIRRLNNVQDFFADTSTIRLTNETKNFEGRGEASKAQIRRKRSFWT